jgi:hypothetical protein
MTVLVHNQKHVHGSLGVDALQGVIRNTLKVTYSLDANAFKGCITSVLKRCCTLANISTRACSF